MRWIERGILAVLFTYIAVSGIFPWMEVIPKLAFCDGALLAVMYFYGLSREKEEIRAKERRERITMKVNANDVKKEKKTTFKVWVKTTRTDESGEEFYEKYFLGEFPPKK